MKYYDEINNIMLKEINKKDTIIEIGCGSGTITNRLIKQTNNKYCGSDIRIYNEIITKYKFKFYLDNIEKTCFKKRSFDIVFSEGLIEHVNIEKTIQNMCKMSNKKVIIFFPNGFSLFYLWDKWTNRLKNKFWVGADEYGFEKSVNPFLIIKELRKNGFNTKIISINSFKKDLIFPPIMKYNMCVIGELKI